MCRRSSAGTLTSSRWIREAWRCGRRAAESRPGQIPVNARLNYHYSMLSNGVSLEASEIVTPTSRLQFEGTLAKYGSGLSATFDTSDLRDWDDFINRLRGENTPPKMIAGNAHWQGTHRPGRLSGRPSAGHVKGTAARYDRLYWDEIEGNMTYSPEGFSFTRATARRGRSSAQMELDHPSGQLEFPSPKVRGAST